MNSKMSFSWAVRRLALSVCCLCAPLYAADWAEWRGPDRAGRATDFKAPKSWPKELSQKWKVTVGDGVATPALVGDKLYVFSRQEGSEITRCLEAATGKEVWQEKYESAGASGAAGSFSGPRSSPTVADGKVVTLGVRGMLSCLEATTGKKLWRKDEFQAWPRFHPSSSPIVVDRLVIAQLGGGENGAVVAYDLASGEQKWKSSGESPGYGSPVLMTAGGAKLILAVTERKIMAVNVADGKVAWEAPFTGARYNAATPIVDGQTLILSGRGIKAMKIEKSGDAFAAKELWNNAEKSVQFNTPVLKNGLLYGLTQANEFFCINAQDGQTAWSAPMPSPSTPTSAAATSGGTAAGADGGAGGGRGGRGGRGGGMGGGGGYGSIVDAGSVLLALTPSSQLIVFEPGEKEFKQLASYKVAGTQTHAYPVASGNRVFIKDRDSVILWTVD